MKPRTIRRLVVAGLAAAAVALGVFGTLASATATEVDWSSSVGHTTVR